MNPGAPGFWAGAAPTALEGNHLFHRELNRGSNCTRHHRCHQGPHFRPLHFFVVVFWGFFCHRSLHSLSRPLNTPMSSPPAPKEDPCFPLNLHFHFKISITVFAERLVFQHVSPNFLEGTLKDDLLLLFSKRHPNSSLEQQS